MKNDLGNWINFNRDILDIYSARIITRAEYLTYLHLRLCCTPYAKCKTSLADIRTDVFGNKATISYVNKILLSLKSKRLIWYADRKGSRGSFDVHFDNFILPEGKISNIQKNFDTSSVRAPIGCEATLRSEATTEVKNGNQMLESTKKALIKRYSSGINYDDLRGNNNDNDNENDNNIIDSNNSFKEIDVSSYKPNSYEEEKCRDMASTLGEKNMNFILSVLKKHGFNVAERAYQITCDSENVLDKPRYFNRIVQQIINGEL